MIRRTSITFGDIIVINVSTRGSCAVKEVGEMTEK